MLTCLVCNLYWCAFIAFLTPFPHLQAQNREYDQYYTNTTLDDLYKKANELRSLAAKEENYDEAERNFQLSDAQLAAAANFLETMYVPECAHRSTCLNVHDDMDEMRVTPISRLWVGGCEQIIPS